MLVGMWLLLSCIAYWEHRKWVFSTFLFSLGPCVCSVPGHQVRPILLDRTPGAISVDGPHPDQELWEQTHHSRQRHQHVTFASYVFFWADVGWVRSGMATCGVLGQNLHCWCQRRELSFNVGWGWRWTYLCRYDSLPCRENACSFLLICLWDLTSLLTQRHLFSVDRKGEGAKCNCFHFNSYWLYG